VQLHVQARQLLMVATNTARNGNVLCYPVAFVATLQYDLDDNGRLDSNEFVKMVATLGADVSTSEAEAAMEVSQLAVSP
jgi:hypothetical protein